jgi:hypothetical protein
LLQYARCRTQSPHAGARLPNSMPNDDALMRSIGRIPVIRAQLASRPWPLLAHLSPAERDVVLDTMALRDFRSERDAAFAART